MKIFRGVLIGVLLSGAAQAQTFMCGSSACASNIQPWAVDVITGIDGLHVDGNVYNVIFSNTAPAISPFVFSNTTSKFGQPLTGVDAGNALSNFYSDLLPPWDGYAVVGDPGPAFITAWRPAGSLSSSYYNSPVLYDLAQTTVGGGSPGQTPISASNTQTQVVGSNYYHGNGGTVQFTTWVPVNSAPELDPSSLASALTLLVGALTVIGSSAIKRP